MQVFIPTVLLRPADEKETVVIRLLHDLHSCDIDTSGANTEFVLLRDLVTAISRNHPDAFPPR